MPVLLNNILCTSSCCLTRATLSSGESGGSFILQNHAWVCWRIWGRLRCDLFKGGWDMSRTLSWSSALQPAYFRLYKCTTASQKNILGVPHTLVADAGGTDCTLSKGLPYMGSAFFSSIVIWNCGSALFICRTHLVTQHSTCYIFFTFRVISSITAPLPFWQLQNGRVSWWAGVQTTSCAWFCPSATTQGLSKHRNESDE